MPAIFFASRVELDAKQELGRYQDGLDRQLDPAVEAVAILDRQVDELHQFRQLARGDGPAIGATGELFDDRPGHFGNVRLGLRRPEDDPPVRLGERIAR